MNYNASNKTVLPAHGQSWTVAIATLEEEIPDLEKMFAEAAEESGKLYTTNGLMEFYRRLLREAKLMEKYCACLSRVIDRVKGRRLYTKLPKKIRVDNEYGVMFEINLQLNPPLYSSYQDVPHFFYYNNLYFDGELVLVEERVPGIYDRATRKVNPQPSVIVLNRIESGLYIQMKSFFQSRSVPRG